MDKGELWRNTWQLGLSITIKHGVDGLTDMHLRGLGSDEADETLPLLLWHNQIDIHHDKRRHTVWTGCMMEEV
jgi:hypothetical protein